jgi:predicted Rossmann fold flavoprotein
MAAISAGRAARDAGRPLSIVAFDGAAKLGAKILVAGGGRCNVTHYAVDESAYAGSTRPAIRKVLGRFGVDRTIEFFRDLGVELKREDTGKLFPTTDNARTVLNALLQASADAGVSIRNPARVTSIEIAPGGFRISVAPSTDDAAVPPQTLHVTRLVLAAGGRALPRSGSDGAAYAFAKSLGHSLTHRIFPALVPLTLPREHFLCTLSGVSADATLEVRSGTGKRLASFTNSTLCTHFGLSGPAVLDISRYYLDAKVADPGASLIVNWVPGLDSAQLDDRLQTLARQGSTTTIATLLADHLPERLARALCDAANANPAWPAHRLTREQRQSLVRAATELPLPITGDRGFTHAEVTAGGVPLGELHLNTMESRVRPGLFICGEILDVDGRIGGFNFQWAWASGFVAGSAAAHAALAAGPAEPKRLKSPTA